MKTHVLDFHSVAEQPSYGEKTVTVRQVAEAMISDRTKKSRGNLIRFKAKLVMVMKKIYDYFKSKDVEREVSLYEPVAIAASCAIGGAAIGLGLHPKRLEDALADVRGAAFGQRGKYGYTSDNLAQFIINKNDDAGTSKAEIGHAILDKADPKTLDSELHVRSYDYSGFGH